MSADTDRTDPPTPDALTHILERVARAEQLPQTYTVLPTDRSQPGVRLNDDGSVYREHYHRAIFGQDDVDFATAALAALPSAPDQRLREALDDIDDAATEYINAVLAYLDPENQYTESRHHAMSEASASLVLAIFRARALSEATTSPEATLDVERIIADVRGSTPHDDSEYRRGFDRALDKFAARLRGPA